MKTSLRPYREFGLGEDGELYSQFVGDEDEYREDLWSLYEDANWGINLREMKEIVKAFGHLVIFT